MAEKVIVHPRVQKRHPDIVPADVTAAWDNFIRLQQRTGIETNHYAAIGVDEKGRLLEMVAAKLEKDTWLIFHASKATAEMLKEMGLKDGRRHR